MGDNQASCVLRIPPGVAHGCKSSVVRRISSMVTSKVYDPSDEGRIPYDDPTIDYDWMKGPVIK